MNRYAGCLPHAPTQELVEPQPHGNPLQEDVDMSSGSSGNETSENHPTRGSEELGVLGGPPVAHQG